MRNIEPAQRHFVPARKVWRLHLGYFDDRQSRRTCAILPYWDISTSIVSSGRVLSTRRNQGVFPMKTTLAAVAALMIAVSPAAAQTPTFVDTQNNTEVLGTDFIGTPVQDKSGQQIGKIANLVFDQTGRIELAVIGVGGFLGIGEKDLAVPFDTVKSEVANGKHVFVIDATKDQLTAAPVYKTLNAQARAERVKEWREKAQASWTDIKGRTSKAYEEAKEKVEGPTAPKQ